MKGTRVQRPRGRIKLGWCAPGGRYGCSIRERRHRGQVLQDLISLKELVFGAKCESPLPSLNVTVKCC